MGRPFGGALCILRGAGSGRGVRSLIGIWATGLCYSRGPYRTEQGQINMQDIQQIVLAARPEAMPSPSDFRLERAQLPLPGEGQFLVRVIWLSLDPYMRGRMSAAKSYAPPVEIGAAMAGACVGQVMLSQHGDFAVGDYVVGPFGWASHALSDGVGVRVLDRAMAPLSTALGALGMPGMTAWTGLNRIAQAQAGETLVVSAATGAVGAMVGQLAARKGMRVIGIAGGAEKCRFAEANLGFDVCLDHRGFADDTAFAAAMAEAAPKGVDVYFDNVGAAPLQAVLPNMAGGGRIALCGMIGWFAGAPVQDVMALPAVWRFILTKRLRVQGFIVFDHYDHFPEFLAEVAPLLADGTICYRETVAEGLEAAPEAFIGMLTGHNFGKQLVRIAPET